MKKIIIFAHAMELGGAERALLGLLENIDYSKVSVDLFLMHHTGELLEFIPSEVNMLPESLEYSSIAVPIKNVLYKRQIKVLVGRIFAKARAKCQIKKLKLPSDNNVELEYSHKYTLWAMPMLSERRYDLAISFLTPHYFIANKVEARKKAAWIHTDYSKVKVDIESEYKMWNQYDVIVSISNAVTQSFLQVFPKLKDKIIVIENMLPQKSIRGQATEFDARAEMKCSDDTICLLSIGRFCKAKNFDNIPDICKYLVEKKLNINWYLIGYGSDENLIRNRIIEVGMEAHVFILGKKKNPYPYIEACDIYIQPSRYEGNSVTVHEAQMLGKLVIITRYETSESQLREGVDGIIVPMDNKGCADGIAKAISNKGKIKRIVEQCKERDYSNAAEINKIYKMC